jgi:hypothetical protein
MKQVFECGIVAESNDEVGDTFMAGMLGIALPPTKNKRLPDDFTLELQQYDLVRGRSLQDGQDLIDAYETLKRGMIERGYECIQWTDHDRWCYCYRFRRVKK